MPEGREWYELACLWSGYLKNGIASEVVKKALQHARREGRKVFALSTSEQAKRLFERMGFVSHGTLKSLQRNTTFELPKALQEYDTSKRQPSVFTSGLRKTMPSRAEADAIADHFAEADAFEEQTLYHGRSPDSHALTRAKWLLARYGRTIDNWQVVSDRYNFRTTSRLTSAEES
jgi:hypothetical protein